jgi:hypothetical protein
VDTEIAAEYNNSHLERNPMSQFAVTKLLRKFMETDSVIDEPSSGRPSIPEEIQEVVIAKVHASPKKSISHTAAELDTPKSTVHKVLHAQKGPRDRPI